MPRFFIPAAHVASGRAEVRDADALHLARSLRIRSDEMIVVVDDGGREHGVRVDVVTPSSVAGTVLWSRPATGEPALRLTVLQALPQQGMDEAVFAMAAVGVAAIVPVVTRRTVVRPDATRARGRTARWKALAREAAGLACRGTVPDVTAPVALDTAVACLASGTELLVADPEAMNPLTGAIGRGVGACAVVIGPEGGLDADEARSLAAAGARAGHVGARILPARLAGTIVAAILLGAAGDLAAPPAPPPVEPPPPPRHRVP